MATVPQSSLFESRSEAGVSTSLNQVETLLLGDVSTVIAIVALASAGFLMLSGRLGLLRSMRVIVGCVVLFGASTITPLLMGSGDGAEAAPRIHVDAEKAHPREELQPSHKSPYSQASIK